MGRPQRGPQIRRPIGSSMPQRRRHKRHRHSLFAIITAAAAAFAASPAGAAPAPPVLISGAAVLNPDGTGVITGRQLLLQDGRIRRIAAAIDAPPADTIRIDARGCTVLPGLIDLHTHLFLHPYDEASWDDQVLRESLALRTVRATAAARRTLEAGFTTIRDLGTEGADYADVGLRDAIAAGIVPGPRIFAATRAIVARGCYGPAGFDPRWEVPKGAQEVSGVDEMRRAVREQISHGADWIKVYADYHRAPGAPTTPTFTLQELEAAVGEARTAGLPVAAHATTVEGIRRSVQAGVSTIEHGYEADEEMLRWIQGGDITLCPTLAAAEAYEKYFGGWKPGQPDTPRLKQAKEMVRKAVQMGVVVACGSDAGVFAHGDNVRELELLVECGMTPAQAVAAATRVAANVLKRDDLGRMAEGATADLVIVRGDPLKDIAALRRPMAVIKEGQVVVQRP